MKTRNVLLTGLMFGAMSALTLTLTLSNAAAQDTVDEQEHGTQFVDADGDGYNDNAPDIDGDGIPNGQDADYAPQGDGNRRGSRSGSGEGVHGNTFVDEDGDGFNDNAPDIDGDGIPNGQDADYVRQEDGSGRGSRSGNTQGKGTARVHRTRVQTEADYGNGASIRQRLQDGNGSGSMSQGTQRGGNSLRGNGGNSK